MINTVMTEQRASMRDAEDLKVVGSKAITIPAVRVPHLRLGALVAIGLATFFVGWLVGN